MAEPPEMEPFDLSGPSTEDAVDSRDRLCGRPMVWAVQLRSSSEAASASSRTHDARRCLAPSRE